jgi:glutamine amidotransferase
MITILDYGMGNIGSLENMIRKVGGTVTIAREPEQLLGAEKLVLPGVGHFGYAMAILEQRGFRGVLDRKVLGERCPILCICLGAQLVTEGSEEGGGPGLGWIQGRTVRFRFEGRDRELKLPHMGWSGVTQVKESRLLAGMHPDPCFYFVHSFHLVCDAPGDALATTRYGYEFISAVEHENIFATQFHPEKSHKYGLKLVKNFVEL